MLCRANGRELTRNLAKIGKLCSAAMQLLAAPDVDNLMSQPHATFFLNDALPAVITTVVERDYVIEDDYKTVQQFISVPVLQLLITELRPRVPHHTSNMLMSLFNTSQKLFTEDPYCFDDDGSNDDIERFCVQSPSVSATYVVTVNAFGALGGFDLLYTHLAHAQAVLSAADSDTGRFGGAVGVVSDVVAILSTVVASLTVPHAQAAVIKVSLIAGHVVACGGLY